MSDLYSMRRGGFRAALGQRKSNQDKFLSRKELEALLASARADGGPNGMTAYDLFALAGNFGLRCSEAIDLRPDDFSAIQNGYFRVRTLKQKGHKDDRVYIGDTHSPLTHDIVARRSRSRKFFSFTSRTARYLFAYYSERAGISPNVSFHSLRHTAARMMLTSLKGTELSTEAMNIVAAFLRHKPQATQIYTTPSPEAMIQAMDLKGVVR